MTYQTEENLREKEIPPYSLLIPNNSNYRDLEGIEKSLRNKFQNNVSSLMLDRIIEQSVKINYEEHQKSERELPSSQDKCSCDEYKLSYDELLKYQRMINLGMFDEIQPDKDKHSFFYRRINSVNNKFEDNTTGVINEEVVDALVEFQTNDSEKPSEWSIIPDIFILYPVKYPSSYKNETKSDFENLKKHIDEAEKNYCSIMIERLKKALNDRKETETNIPAININYLGKILCHIKSNKNNNDKLEKSLGNPVWVDFLFVRDQKSSSGVVVFCSLSTPFLMSYLLDAISNNDLIVRDDEADNDTSKCKNIESFFKEKYKITVHGTAKALVIIPKNKDCLTLNQRSALLASEAIMPSNCGYGHIIDDDIMAAAKNNIGQYDRADVYAYSTVLLVFNEDLQGSVKERMEIESITLFYIILILMEEASICIANDEIVNLLADVKSNDKSKANKKKDETIEFLKKTDVILSEYAKTIDFWKAQLRFPTSQRSLDNIRKAFKIDDKLSVFKRNQQQLQTLFNIKSEIKDRISELQTTEILFLLSVLALLSVINDSIDLVPKLLQLGEVVEVDAFRSFLRLLSKKILWLQLIMVGVIVVNTGFLYRRYNKRL